METPVRDEKRKKRGRKLQNNNLGEKKLGEKERLTLLGYGFFSIIHSHKFNIADV